MQSRRRLSRERCQTYVNGTRSLCALPSLLSATGSIFVQIGDENVHHVRELLDSVFGTYNSCGQIVVKKATGLTSELIAGVNDYLLWYACDKEQVKYRHLYTQKNLKDEATGEFRWFDLGNGCSRRLTDEELADVDTIDTSRLFRTNSGVSPGIRANTTGTFEYKGLNFYSGANRNWKTTLPGMVTLAAVGRLALTPGATRIYKQFWDDFPLIPVTNLWVDVRSEQGRVYVVQTQTKIIERCMLMTTDPSDLVVDPTCGSGTTASVAEQWGRRWIAIDTSRVAIAIARQRLLTSTYAHFKVKEPSVGVSSGLVYKKVPHLGLSIIANNRNLDAIIDKNEPTTTLLLEKCNECLRDVDEELRQNLEAKCLAKERREGKKSITEAERRKWILPARGEEWKHWTIPVESDSEWPTAMKEALAEYRKEYQRRQEELDECIAANAPQHELVDHPEVVKAVVRVSGPFTVEAVQPSEMSLGQLSHMESPIGGAPEELDTFEGKNAEAYLDHMMKLLKMDGVRFPDNKEQEFSRLERVTGNDSAIHAEGRWVVKGEVDPDADGRATVAVAFGPQYGPVTAQQVEGLIRSTSRRGYDDLVVAGFSFDGPAQAVITESQHPKLRIHIAHIRPDVNPGMDGLLKEKPGSQLFTVFGQPRTTVDGPDKNGEFRVTMEGVDIYDPVTNTIQSTENRKVAAWFLDGDYDGRTFCITQAFFPDKTAWAKLSMALNGVVDPERFEAFSGTLSLPFPLGKHKCVAVKVIDPKYFRLWHHITSTLQPREKHASGKPKAEVAYREAEGALKQIAGQWVERFKYIEESNPDKEQIPPVLIIVCDNTDIADVFFQKISGESEVEVVTPEDVKDVESGNFDDKPKKKRRAKPKKQTVYGGGVVFPEFLANTETEKRTIRIDSKLLAEAESEDPNKSRKDIGEELRKVIATVGKRGEPGESVRCVVSVSMLTEGWDANNVTHILGLRAFGSQLLCEQVVGRGLRRINYEPVWDEEEQKHLLPPEYVDVYGIPFSVIPFKGRPVDKPTPEDKPQHRVWAIPDREEMEIRFPIVEGYVFQTTKGLLKCDIDNIEKIGIDPKLEPTTTFLSPTAGYLDAQSGSLPFEFVPQDRSTYYNQTHFQSVLFQITQRLIDQFLAPSAANTDKKSRVFRLQSRHQLFPQVFQFVKAFADRRIDYNGVDKRELGLEKYTLLAVERLRDSIHPDDSAGEPPLLPILNRYRPMGSTASVDFPTRRPVTPATKSHINLVVQHSNWEAQAATLLDASDLVKFHARNDHVGLVIPYEYLGVDHSYEPDFLVRLINDVTLILEIKGYEVHGKEQNNAKHNAAKKWVTAVNNLADFGPWDFLVCRDLETLLPMMAELLDMEAVTVSLKNEGDLF